jgi:hypothetical protein
LKGLYATFLERRVVGYQDTPNFVILISGKEKVLECHSDLRSSEEDLPEHHSCVSHYKNAPANK